MNHSHTSPSHDEQHLSDGRSLRYTRSGAPDGYPVVLHHGTPGSRKFASLLSAAAVEEGVTLITPDRPGYGQSSPPPQRWSWQEWREDLTELLHGESIEEAAILGFSGGGPFAIGAGRAEWASRIALVSSVIPPARNPLAKLSNIPHALQLLFWISDTLASVRGPKSVVRQYTDKPVSEDVARQVAADFHEAFRQNTRAVARENQLFNDSDLSQQQLTLPIRAWHGVDDTNTPIEHVETFIEGHTGELIRTRNDHLGTLLDRKQAILHWLQER